MLFNFKCFTSLCKKSTNKRGIQKNTHTRTCTHTHTHTELPSHLLFKIQSTNRTQRNAFQRCKFPTRKTMGAVKKTPIPESEICPSLSPNDQGGVLLKCIAHLCRGPDVEQLDHNRSAGIAYTITSCTCVVLSHLALSTTTAVINYQ